MKYSLTQNEKIMCVFSCGVEMRTWGRLFIALLLMDNQPHFRSRVFFHILIIYY